MAEVFKAKAFGVEGFERLVAVKRILPSIAEDQEFITMFIDEAKIAVQLTHANVAQIFDLGKVGDSYFIAMEYVSGKDLRAIFDRVRKRAETVPVPMACYSIMKVCEGLDYAHRRRDPAGNPMNIIHRDVSPQNILVSYEGEIKIIDFGIAKAANRASNSGAAHSAVRIAMSGEHILLTRRRMSSRSVSPGRSPDTTWPHACTPASVRPAPVRSTGPRTTFEIAALAAHILAAPEEIRQTLFEIEGGEIAALLDRKLIFRAEPAAD